MIDCPEISFGEDVRRPDLLEDRRTTNVLYQIREGQWEDAVARVRSLPADSPEQKAAKIQLPFCTWAGVFSRREANGLRQHSGQVGIDLDGLGEAGAVAVLQAAVADAYCLAAFRSTRGEGVRLIFRIPPCSPEDHAHAFEQVSAHVLKVYGHEPDTSGKDVSRASFVSFDRGLWFNQSAEILPIQIRGETQRIYVLNRCVSPALYAGRLADTWASWYGRHYASILPIQDGAAKTHYNLLDLGKAIALHAHRIKEPPTPKIIDPALEAWLAECRRSGIALRCSAEEYRLELFNSVKGCSKKPWFKAAAEKWLRWTRHRDFPHEGLPHEKILFAIRQHCAESGSNEFYLGVRDAGLIAGVSCITAWRRLVKLCEGGHIHKAGVPSQARHAQTFRLGAKSIFSNKKEKASAK